MGSSRSALRLLLLKFFILFIIVITVYIRYQDLYRTRPIFGTVLVLYLYTSWPIIGHVLYLLILAKIGHGNQASFVGISRRVIGQKAFFFQVFQVAVVSGFGADFTNGHDLASANRKRVAKLMGIPMMEQP